MQVVLSNRASSAGPGLLEVLPGDDRHGILHLDVVLAGHELFAIFFSGDGFADSGLGGSLAELGHIGSGEAFALGSEEIKIDVGGYGTLSEHGLDNADPRGLIRKGDIDQLIETTGSNKSLIKNFGSVGSSNEE